MTQIVAVNAALEEAADNLYLTIGERIENITERKAAAFVFAAMRTHAWTGDPARHLAGIVFGGLDGTTVKAAESEALKVSDPWRQLREWAEEPDRVDLFARLLRQHAPSAAEAGSSTFDLDGEAEGPRWIIDGLLERGFVHAVSGDTGAGKSIVRDAITAAGLRGEPFLGRDVNAHRFMVIDGENPSNLERARLMALGMNNEHWPRLHFTGREKGVLLGRPEWDEWLRQEVEAFAPDVIFIDTVAKCCAVSLLDNDSVIALYRDVLGPLVQHADCALVLFTHERKGRGGGAGDRSQELMGARQWADQADAHLTLAPTGKFQKSNREDGDFDTRRPFALRTPKHRWADVDKAEHYEIVGRVRPDRTPVELSVRHPQAEPTDAQKLVAACGEDRLGRTELSKRVGMTSTGTRFRNGLAEALGDGRLVQGEDKLYAVPEPS